MRTLVELFHDRVARTPDLAAMRWREAGEWKVLTYREFSNQALKAAAGLAGLGVKKGDRVAIVSGNRPEWLVFDVAAMIAGAITVPVYSTSSAGQIAHIVGHSGSSVALVENEAHLASLLEARDKLPDLRAVVLLDPLSVSGGDHLQDAARGLHLVSFPQLKDYADVDALAGPGAAAPVEPDDVATIVYTSGTTGLPKGAMLTHAGFVAALKTSGEVLQLREGRERIVSYLPLSHIFERLNAGWGSVYFGMEVWFAESVDKLLDNLKDCRPTFFIGVPRVYEKFYAGMKKKIAGHPKRRLIEKAVGLGLARFDLEQAGRKAPLILSAKIAVLDKVVLSKLREGIGMQCVRVAITGGAPIEPEILKFIRAIGIELVEGYGQTETNAPTAITPPGKVRLGAVGPPVPGLDVKFSPDGEILVKGPNVFKGYYHDDAATGRAMTEDGYLRTGDVGEMDTHGYLCITDRKKDLIKTAGGKYIAPQAIESKLKLEALIGQAVVIGDRRAYPTALLTLDAEAALKWAQDRDLAGASLQALSENHALLDQVGAAVAQVNANLSHAEQVKKWTLLAKDFTEGAEEMTPTLKVRRQIVAEKYGDLIEKMYEQAPG